jgi:Mrp family chromosome partitioning ATPase
VLRRVGMEVGADAATMGVKGVKQVVLVLSGKGGVGKSTVACQVATLLAARGKRVGILDVDLCGPSIARVLGVEGREVLQSSNGWVPVVKEIAVEDGSKGCLAIMTIAFMLPNRDHAVVWRGPKKNSMVKQLLDDVQWGELDILLIDTPPGTSDEQISTLEHLANAGAIVSGAVLVTTPQAVSVVDVRKEISFCRKMRLPILGIVENMSGFVCPCCEQATDIFSKGGGEALAAEFATPFLGRIPIDPRLAECQDRGMDALADASRSPSVQVRGVRWGRVRACVRVCVCLRMGLPFSNAHVHPSLCLASRTFVLFLSVSWLSVSVAKGKPPALPGTTCPPGYNLPYPRALPGTTCRISLSRTRA